MICLLKAMRPRGQLETTGGARWSTTCASANVLHAEPQRRFGLCYWGHDSTRPMTRLSWATMGSPLLPGRRPPNTGTSSGGTTTPLARPVEFGAESTVPFMRCVIPPLDQRFPAARWMTRSHADAEDLLQLDCLNGKSAIRSYSTKASTRQPDCAPLRWR